MSDIERVVSLLRHGHGDPQEVADILGTDLATIHAVLAGGGSLPAAPGGGGGGAQPDFNAQFAVNLTGQNGYNAGTGEVDGPGSVAALPSLEPRYDDTISNLVTVEYRFDGSAGAFLQANIYGSWGSTYVIRRQGGVHGGDAESYVVPPGNTPGIDVGLGATIIDVLVAPLTP